MRLAALPLRGAGGERVDFARTIVSHEVAELPLNRADLDVRTLETTLPVAPGARTVRITESDGQLRIEAVATNDPFRIGRGQRHLMACLVEVCCARRRVGWSGEGRWRSPSPDFRLAAVAAAVAAAVTAAAAGIRSGGLNRAAAR